MSVRKKDLETGKTYRVHLVNFDRGNETSVVVTICEGKKLFGKVAGAESTFLNFSDGQIATRVAQRGTKSYFTRYLVNYIEEVV